MLTPEVADYAGCADYGWLLLTVLIMQIARTALIVLIAPIVLTMWIATGFYRRLRPTAGAHAQAHTRTDAA
ncbi:hypothetical protein JNC05_06040 [Paraburkholderia ginsengiterrae]|nr:hypothetical protein [Paraburkholderia ginsengiterrae]